MNLFALFLRLPYILVLTATCFSSWLSISLSMFLSLFGSWKKQESMSSVFKFATFGRQKKLYIISFCRQPPCRCKFSPGTSNMFCLPAFHLLTSHPHQLSENVKSSGETRYKSCYGKQICEIIIITIVLTILQHIIEGCWFFLKKSISQAFRSVRKER